MFRSRKFVRGMMTIMLLAGVLLAPSGMSRAQAGLDATTGLIWYVATTGSNSNSCSAADAPCLTMNGALAKAAAGDTILVAIGTYMPTTGAVVVISKNIVLSGGWNADFTEQAGYATVDGMAAFRGITIDEGKIVSIDHFVVQNGSDGSQGGGVYSRGNLTLDNSIVTHNRSGWMGGGIYVYGTLTTNNTTISDNTAGSGGSGGAGGGGIEIYSGSATLNNSTLSGNKIVGDYSGSAIDAFGTVFLNNTTVSGNTGEEAITASGHLILNNSTVTGNAGGILNSSGTVSLRNSILANNVGLIADCSGVIGSAGYNIIGDSAGCTFAPSAGDQVGSHANPIDPKLGPLSDNGGPTFTHALLSGSPARDAGNPAEPGSGGTACLASDQRGFARPLLSEGRCDIGAYEAQFPAVISILRLGSSPTSSASVSFSLTFSGDVTGVDTAAPYNDFALATTGVSGAAITEVSGMGASYTVTVNAGSGNGTLRLDVVDDDSIQDAVTNKPLGGPGVDNGSFRDGQAYVIARIPVPQWPAGTTWDTTPTFRWRGVSGATQYRLQLTKGTTVIYGKVVQGSACTNNICTNTPTTVLAPASYKWRVQAFLEGTWRPYSPYLSFSLKGPKAGLWQGTGLEFYVTPNRTSVDNFAIFISVGGCGSYKITFNPLVPMKNGSFAFTGSFYASGTFTGSTLNLANANGSLGLRSYFIPGCGNVSGGPFPWTATWRTSAQPPAIRAEDVMPTLAIPIPDAPLGQWQVEPARP